MRRLTFISCTAAVVALAVAFVAAPGYAGKGGGGGGGEGSPASNKAYFGINYEGVTFTEFTPTAKCGYTGFDDPNALCTDWVTIYDVPYALKTSTNGGVGVYVSLECSLWTSSSAVAEIGASGWGGSRAGVEVQVLVNGQPAHPGNVVFCDRLQWIQLTIPELFAGITPVTSTDPFVVDLFQRTKAAHAFNYYLATGASEVGVTVQARGIVQCSKDGEVTACKDAGVDEAKFYGETIEAGTKAAIGKSSFVIEEVQNWSSSTYP